MGTGVSVHTHGVYPGKITGGPVVTNHHEEATPSIKASHKFHTLVGHQSLDHPLRLSLGGAIELVYFTYLPDLQ